MDIISYILAKNYTNAVALGIGSMRVEGSTVYFTIAKTGEEVGVTLPTPKSGASITDVNIKEVSNEYHLICTITDADGNKTEKDAGIIPNAKVQIASKTTAGIVKVGDNLEIKSDGTLSAIGGGASPTISTERNSTDNGVDIIVTNSDGTTSTATVYDGNSAEPTIIDERLVFNNNSNASVVGEILKI